MISRDEIIAANPIKRELEDRGVALKGNGNRLMCLCPFHEDKSPSMTVDVEKGLWNCFGCQRGGSVIDLVCEYERKRPEVVMREMADKIERFPVQRATVTTSTASESKSTKEIERIYSYRDHLGSELFQVVRYKPKTFRQRHQKNGGPWIWTMEGVERVLYRLPEITKSETVWICEGEKDAETLAEIGYQSTCNVGGAGKWLDSYTESLAGKDVAICGDTDDAGRKHVELVFESLAGKVKTARIIDLPRSSKDATEFVSTFATKADARAALDALFDIAQPFTKGIKLPIFKLEELEERYIRHVANLRENVLDLAKWLPSFRGNVRPLVQGELVTILAATGVGKTACLQNIAVIANPLPTLLFELELPSELMYERFVALHCKMDCRDVETAYASQNDRLGKEALQRSFPHLYICTESRMKPTELERLITRSELKIGTRPKVVLLDYVGLVQGVGNSRYEKLSSVAEELKVIAKATQTIIIMASQVARPKDDNPEITLHDAKDSGSIENSSGLVLGVWRDSEDSTLMNIKVLKNTKGLSGFTIPCNYEGSKILITERAKETSHYGD